MSALSRSLPLIAMLATSAAFAPQHVAAASLTGAFSFDMTGTMTATFDGSSITGLSYTGGVSVENSLSRFRVESPLGWRVDGELSVPDTWFAQVSEIDPTPRAWAGPDPIALTNHYTIADSSLFSLVRFFGNPPAMSGTGTLGGIPGVDWSLSNVVSDTTGVIGDPIFGTTLGQPITVTADFSFMVGGTGVQSFLGMLGGLGFPELTTNAPSTSFDASFTATPIPVPAALPLLAGGLGLLGLMGWYRRRTAA